jgi:hypothetical protein
MNEKQKQDVLNLLPIITGIVVILIGIEGPLFITIWMTISGITMITYGIIKMSWQKRKNDRQN